MKHNSGARPDDTRAALLAAARRLFARSGYDGTSIRAITSAARANLGAVTYHFGSKQSLYETVLEQVVSPLAARVKAAVEGPGSTLDRAERAVRAFFEHYEENPEMPKLMLQEIAAGKPAPPPIARVMGVVSARLCDLVREGQAAGEIRAGDAGLLARSIVSQPVFLTITARIVEQVPALFQGSLPTHAQVVDHAARFARAGLAALPEAA